MGHDNAADQPGGYAPGGLERIDLLVILVGKFNIKSLGKAVAEVVGGAGLQRLAVMHHAFDGIGRFGAVELFLVGLLAPGHGHGKHILTEVGIHIQHGLGESLGFLRSGVNGVPFLPQKFPVAQERPGSLLPTQDAAPLIILHGKIPVGLKDMGEMLTEKGLRGGPDGIPLLQLVHTAMGDPRTLRGKSFHMVFLLL